MIPEDPLLAVAILFALFLPLTGLLLRRRFSRNRRKKQDQKRKWVIIDGSNVMYWNNGEPDIATVRTAVAYLTQKGFTVGVVFDANAGYLLSGKYQHDGVLSRALKLPEDHVMVVPKGQPADPAILAMARDIGARIVTNDRFRDWANDFPEVRVRGHLIPGSFRSGQLHLRLSHTKKPRKQRAA